MSAHVIDGTAVARVLRAQLGSQVEELAAAGQRPGLATLMVGEDYTARAYERRLRRIAERVGCHYVAEQLAADAAEADALATVGKLCGDPRISGILVLRPLPAHICEVVLYQAMDPLKDIEAVHPVNAGLLALGRPRFVPSTPASAFHLVDRYLADTGRDPAAVYPRCNVVVVGRSNNVGKPAVLLGASRNATVVSCDVHTYRAGLLREHTRRADILIVAVGVPGLVTGEDVKDGVIAVDVGINPVPDAATGKISLVGDLDFASVAARAEAISPVPGGVGPITDVWLLRNTVSAARMHAEVAPAQPILTGLRTDDLLPLRDDLALAPPIAGSGARSSRRSQG